MTERRQNRHFIEFNLEWKKASQLRESDDYIGIYNFGESVFRGIFKKPDGAPFTRRNITERFGSDFTDLPKKGCAKRLNAHWLIHIAHDQYYVLPEASDILANSPIAA